MCEHHRHTSVQWRFGPDRAAWWMLVLLERLETYLLFLRCGAGVALVGLHWLGHLGALFEVGIHCSISPLPSEINSAGVDGAGLVH